MKEICIAKSDEETKIYLIENRQIVERNCEEASNPMIEGNIFIGKIQNVLPGMQAAFVRIGYKKNAFIHLRDLLPKKDVTQENSEVKQDIRNLVKPRR